MRDDGVILGQPKPVDVNRGNRFNVDEETILLLSTIAAEVAQRINSARVPRGSEVAQGGALGITFHELPLATASDGISIGSPVRSLAIYGEGDPEVTIRLVGYDGRTAVDIPATTGLCLNDCAALRVSVIVPAGRTGTLRIATSPLAFQFHAGNGGDGGWIPFVEREVGTGAVGPAHTLEAGFDYELHAVSVLIVNDATAANRVLHLAVFPPDAIATDAPIGSAWVDANIVASTQGLLHANFGGGGARFNDTGVSIVRPAGSTTIEQYGQCTLPQWRGRVAAAAASPNLEVVVSNGVAGDVVSLTLMGMRRPL